MFSKNIMANMKNTLITYDPNLKKTPPKPKFLTQINQKLEYPGDAELRTGLLGKGSVANDSEISADDDILWPWKAREGTDCKKKW